jgi:hypothetical protein
MNSAHERSTQYCELFEPVATRQAVFYCYPDYYRTMGVRLYAFQGRGVTDVRPWVVFYDERLDQGRIVKKIIREVPFTRLEDAEHFVRTSRTERVRIVSKDPLVSCVPLEPLTGFMPVYRSLGHQARSDGTPGPSAVQVYEYQARRSAGSS